MRRVGGGPAIVDSVVDLKRSGARFLASTIEIWSLPMDAEVLKSSASVRGSITSSAGPRPPAFRRLALQARR